LPESGRIYLLGGGLNDFLAFREESLHVLFKKKPVGYAPEPTPRRGVVEHVSHSSQTIHAREQMIVIKPKKSTPNLRIAKRPRAIIRRNPAGQPLADSEMGRLPSDFLPEFHLSVGDAAHRPLLCPGGGLHMYVHVPRQIEAALDGSPDRGFDHNNRHINSVNREIVKIPDHPSSSH